MILKLFIFQSTKPTKEYHHRSDGSSEQMQHIAPWILYMVVIRNLFLIKVFVAYDNYLQFKPITKTKFKAI